MFCNGDLKEAAWKMTKTFTGEDKRGTRLVQLVVWQCLGRGKSAKQTGEAMLSAFVM